jgi:TolB-like protein
MAQEELALCAFRLDLVLRRMSHEGLSVELKAKAFDILCVLAVARGAVVTKDELMSKVWPELVVEENNIQVHVSALRKVLSKDPSGAIHLMTVPGQGYRLLVVGAERASPSIDSLPRRGPSVAVLPFAYLGDEPEQEYFADGVVEDIITGLTRVKWLVVVARQSSFNFRGPGADLSRAARELSADYLLQGSFRRSGDRLRVTAYLTETTGGTELWANRYDRRIGNVFELQDDIAGNVVGAIEPGLRQAEIARIRRWRPDSLETYDLVLRALPHVYKLMPAGCAPAIPLLRMAVEREPDYALAHAALAWCHHVLFSRGGLLVSERESAIRHARAAVSLAADDPLALAIGAFVIWFDAHETEVAFDLFDQALSISPSNVVALATSAVALAWSGQTEQAIMRAERALQLSPFDALRYLAYMALAGANFQLRNYAKAHRAANRAVESNPDFSVPYAYLCASLVRLGRLEEARAVLRRILALDRDFCIARFRGTVGVNEVVFEDFADAWRAAGMPE